jgi:hypothetical protein
MVYPRRLTWRQAEILRATERYLVLVAGRRFGKTTLAVAWLVQEILRGSLGALAYYVLPFRHQAKAVAWDELKRATKGLRVCDPNESELTVTLRGERKIALKGADDPESLEGVGLQAVVLDEFARMKLAAWERSLRPALSDKNGRALFIGKPRGRNHLHKFFRQGHGPTRVNGWRAWQFRTIDGGFVSAEDVAEAQRDLPPKIFRQEYLATFETLAGRIYEEFLLAAPPRGHVLPAQHVPPANTFESVAIGIDWGFTNPFAAVAMGDNGGRRVVAAEEFGAEFSTEMVEAALGRLVERFPEAQLFADPARPDLIDEFSRRLNRTILGATNDVHEGLLELMTLVHPREGLGPRLLVSDECPRTIEGLDGYVWDTDREGNALERPRKKNDHTADATRYAAMGLRQSEAGAYTPAPRGRSQRGGARA